MKRLAIGQQVASDMTSASWIRAMFEVGQKLKAEHGAANVFDFSLGNPNVPPPVAFFDALRRLATQPDPAAHRYMTNVGFLETREALARFLSHEYRLRFDPADIVMTCGAAGGMNVVLRTLLDPGDEVIVLSPYFVEYRFYIQQCQGRMVLVETDRDCQPDVGAIGAAINERTRAIIVNTPNNPTGVVYPEERCRALGDALRRHDRPEQPIYLICDDIYRRVVYDMQRCPAPAEHYERSIIVSSFSKDLSIPGERIGYVALPDTTPQRELLMGAMGMLNRTLGYVNAPALMQRVLPGCVESRCDTAFYRGNRDLLAGGLRRMGYEVPTPGGAFYLFPFSPMADDKRFCDLLMEQRIIAVPGRGFGRAGHFRLAYAVERETVERSLGGFEAALKAARGR